MDGNLEILLKEVYDTNFRFEFLIDGVKDAFKRRLCNTPVNRLSDEQVIRLKNIISNLEKVISSIDDSLGHLDDVIAAIKYRS